MIATFPQGTFSLLLPFPENFINLDILHVYVLWLFGGLQTTVIFKTFSNPPSIKKQFSPENVYALIHSNCLPFWTSLTLEGCSSHLTMNIISDLQLVSLTYTVLFRVWLDFTFLVYHFLNKTLSVFVVFFPMAPRTVLCNMLYTSWWPQLIN